MKSLLILVSILVATISIHAQAVGINNDTPDASAILDIASSDKGILIPRMKKISREGIVNPVMGLLVFELESESFWHYSSAGWVELENDGVFENNLGVVRNKGDHSTDDFVFGSVALPGTLPISDSLFFFDKSKAAFRAGRLGNSDRWAPSNIGFGSVALGYNNKASGDYSTALGLESESEGIYSFTAGTLNKATGTASMALGFVTEANGYTSLSAGFGTKADSYLGTALGQYNVGGGNPNSWTEDDPIFEIGLGLKATTRSNGLTLMKNGDFILGLEKVPPGQMQVDSTLLYFDRSLGAFRAGKLISKPYWSSDNVGIGSFAGGIDTRASGESSVAFGLATNASGDYSTAFGYGNIASGEGALTAGSFNTASEFTSVALGNLNSSTGSSSFASGRQTTASGSFSFSAGNLTTASAAASMAFGSQNEATATASTATGLQTSATALASTSMGFQTEANSYMGLAIGRYNVGNGSGSAWYSGDPLFEIGIGTADDLRENALTVYKDGAIAFKNYTFPLGNGNNDQVLQTDGSGNLKWVDPENSIFKSAGTLTVPKTSYENNDFLIGDSKLPAGSISERLLFFDESLAAFRVGELGASDAWIPSNIGVNSFATGKNTSASNDYSVAMGFSTISSGKASFAMGYVASAEGDYSASFGESNTATGYASFAGGTETSASGMRAVSFGEETDASGENSFSIGELGSATGKNAFNSGWSNDSDGNHSATFGKTSTAVGIASVSMGQFNQVNGNYSAAIGDGLETNSYACTALGRYNKGLGSFPTIWTNPGSEPILEIGIGSLVTRRNAMTIMKNGSVGVGTDSPGALLDIDYDVSLYPFNTAFIVRKAGSGVLSVDDTGNTKIAKDLVLTGRLDMWPSVDYASEYKLELPNIATIEEGVGNAYNWHTYSDSRVKKNVKELSYGLKEVMNLRPVKYHHHSTGFSKNGFEIRDDYGVQIGFIAQEVHEIIEEVVHKPVDDSKELWTMNYSKMTPVLVKAVQEQQELILLLKAELAQKDEEFKELKENVASIMAELSKSSLAKND